MFALVLLGLVASASTAPWYDPDYDGFHIIDRMDRPKNDFHRGMEDLNKNVQKIVTPILSINQEGSKKDGNVYKIFFSIHGYKEEDIVVKAKKGYYMIQANHNGHGDTNNDFSYVQDLPDFVDENGSWSYHNHLLTIYFHIVQHGSDNTTASNLHHNVNSA